MNPLDLFNQVKELIETKDFEAAKTFVAENQLLSLENTSPKLSS